MGFFGQVCTLVLVGMSWLGGGHKRDMLNVLQMNWYIVKYFFFPPHGVYKNILFSSNFLIAPYVLAVYAFSERSVLLRRHTVGARVFFYEQLKSCSPVAAAS